MLARAQLMVFGVMDRYPKLRFVFLESGVCWGPVLDVPHGRAGPSFGGFCPEMKLKADVQAKVLGGNARIVYLLP
ncbi:MAG: hypothetical protein ACLP6E_06120 [Acidimicrobiales bacterium]